MKKFSLFFLMLICFTTYSQQSVFWRSEAANGNWQNGNCAEIGTVNSQWFYGGFGANSSRNRPDCFDGSTTRHNVTIGNNVFTTMTVNDTFWGLRALTFSSGASSTRTLNSSPDDNSRGISFTSGLYNDSNATHNFNVRIGIDATFVFLKATGTSAVNNFNREIFVNANTVVFQGAGNNNVTGTISGSGGKLTKEDAGTTTLSGSLTYTGATSVTGGSLIIQKTGYTATITSSGINVVFSPAPARGNYVVLPGALSSAATLSTSGLAAGQVASYNATSGVLTVNDTPTVSLVSNDADNTFCDGTSVTFIATASNDGGGTVSYNFKVNGNSVQNSAANSYTTTTLTNGQAVTVEITITGGTFLSTNTATSNSISNTVTPQPVWYLDADGDHYYTGSPVSSCDSPGAGYTTTGIVGGGDCNDNQLQYQDGDGDGFGNPAVQVACGATNNFDCNDNQIQYQDLDGDGFGSTVWVACGVTNQSDCNDNQLQYQDGDGDGFGNPLVLVGCGVANNSDCNDNQLQYQDVDGDGFGNPAVLVACGVTNNADCNDNQLQYQDGDGDGFGNPLVIVGCGVANNADCNDNQLQYTDNDSDGFGVLPLVACGVTNQSDCNDNQLQYFDGDGDGFGSTILVGCGVANNADCNDNQLQFTDNDSDGFGVLPLVACGVTNQSDCNDNQLQYFDGDGDGFGSTILVGCGVANNADCNDNQLQFTDNDSDGFGVLPLVACGVTNQSDCNDNQLQYFDGDGDGFGSTILVGCGVANNADCNDNQLQFTDNDSDGFGVLPLVACGVTNNTDCNDNQLQYQDGDSDGFGNPAVQVACGATNNFDCNDNQIQYQDLDGDGFGNAAVHVACGVTNQSDCNDNQLQYQDGDGDGFGNPLVLVGCGVANNTDCNDNQIQYQDLDGDGFGNGAVLVACGVTNSGDCNDAETYYTDSDGDGFGTLPKIGCGSVTNSTDCNDGDISAWQTGTFYADADEDNYSPTPTITQTLCYGATEPAGYSLAVHSEVDCNDASATIYPGAAEICYNNILENCSGTLSQGCAAVPVNMTPSYNNTTLASLATAIPAVGYSYPGASNIKYRFTVTNTTTGASVADIIQTSRFVNIPGSLYSSPGTFTITASAVINDEVVPYAGNTITVFGPTIPKITLAPTSCGATLASLTSTLTASQGQNATGYTFRIRDIGGSVYFTSSSPTRFVNANSFAGFPLSYSTSYLVSVQYSYIDPVTLLSTDSGYGNECTITTPGIPTISMASPTCGSTVAALNAGITATSAANATAYQFRIRLTSNVGGPYTEAAPTASRFSSLTGFGALQYNSSYSISVRYSVVVNSVTTWSSYGPECILNTPNLPTTQLVPSQCGQVAATTLTQQLNIVAYPGFPTYRVRLTEVIGEDVGASQEIVVPYAYFKLNQFTTAQNGKVYNIEVAIKQGAVFGPYSTVCDVHTPAIAKTVKMPFKAVAYPNPFANNFMLDVKTTSESLVNLKVYDMVGRLIDSRNVSVSDLETTTIGNEYPSGVYNVVVSQEDSVETVRVIKR